MSEREREREKNARVSDNSHTSRRRRRRRRHTFTRELVEKIDKRAQDGFICRPMVLARTRTARSRLRPAAANTIRKSSTSISPSARALATSKHSPCDSLQLATQEDRRGGITCLSAATARVLVRSEIVVAWEEEKNTKFLVRTLETSCKRRGQPDRIVKTARN